MVNPATVMTLDRICLTDLGMVDKWRRELQCTERELRAAVYTVGGEPARVRHYFTLSLPEKIAMGLRRLR